MKNKRIQALEKAIELAIDLRTEVKEIELISKAAYLVGFLEGFKLVEEWQVKES